VSGLKVGQGIESERTEAAALEEAFLAGHRSTASSTVGQVRPTLSRRIFDSFVVGPELRRRIHRRLIFRPGESDP
jgi:hypothetical protein